MSRIRTVFSIVVPSMLVGGLLLGSAFGQASGGRDDELGFWPAGSDVTSSGTTDGWRPTPPTPPTPPTRHGGHGGHGGRGGHGGHGRGFSMSIHDGKIEVDGITDMVIEQLDSVQRSLRDNPGIPQDVRDKVLERLERVRGSVVKRLSNLPTADMETFGEEMSKMGDEIDKAMGGLDGDLLKLGDKLGKNFGRKFGKDFARRFAGKLDGHLDSDVDSDRDEGDVEPPEPPDMDDVDVDDADGADFKAAISELKDLALKPAQREAIGRLRTDTDRTVTTAKQQLDDLSNRLHTALADPATSDADISRYVDQISGQEAAIRKARILAWVNARRVLDDGQRRRIEDAARKKGR